MNWIPRIESTQARLRRVHRRLSLCGGLLLGLAMTPAAHAQAYMVAGTNTSATALNQIVVPEPPTFYGPGSTESRAGLSRNDDASFGIAASYARVSNDYGRMSLYADAGSFVSGTDAAHVRGWGTAFAVQQDSFIVSCATCVTGSRGEMTVRLHLGGLTVANGGFLGSPPADASQEIRSYFNTNLILEGPEVPNTPLPGQQFAAYYRANPSVERTQALVAGLPSELGPNGYPEIEFRFGFLFGVPIKMTWSASVSAFVDTTAGANGLTLAQSLSTVSMDDLYWDGLHDVIGSDGQRLLSYTALNSAGINYARTFAAPVPEPASVVLMALGVALLAAFARRGRDPTAT
ncbi:PEP-CTERM sorting domain-containing protein [Roseateles sp. L2-2]|uniref:PEP-CTERM sorting domain-containing protein n=1 Tax=Roseateles TaxID=93681 RepID=UPI003D3607EA